MPGLCTCVIVLAAALVLVPTDGFVQRAHLVGRSAGVTTGSFTRHRPHYRAYVADPPAPGFTQCQRSADCEVTEAYCCTVVPDVFNICCTDPFRSVEYKAIIARSGPDNSNGPL